MQQFHTFPKRKPASFASCFFSLRFSLLSFHFSLGKRLAGRLRSFNNSSGTQTERNPVPASRFMPLTTLVAQWCSMSFPARANPNHDSIFNYSGSSSPILLPAWFCFDWLSNHIERGFLFLLLNGHFVPVRGVPSGRHDQTTVQHSNQSWVSWDIMGKSCITWC